MRFVLTIFTCFFTLISQTSLAVESTESIALSKGRFSVSVGTDYSSGDYGANEDTEIWAIPIGLKYRIGAWRFGLSTAWLHVTSPNTVDADGNFIGSGGKKTTETGIGDVYLSSSYSLIDDRDYLVGLDVIGKVKIPIADEDKFLGTGKVDYSLNLEIFKSINHWTPYWNVGYKWKGDPSGINYKNVWATSLGFEYLVNRDLTLGASYDWQQKVTRFSQNAQEASAYANYYLNDNNKLNFYVLTGYSDASPNWGGGLVLLHYF
jgi:Putative MetA-pathway of phenol degradation